MESSSNVTWHRATVTRERRHQLNNHKSVVLWFTGLSGSGKSTLAHAVEEHQRMLEDPKNAAATFEKCKNSATKKLDAKLKFVNSEFGTSFTTYDIQSRIHRT